MTVSEGKRKFSVLIPYKQRLHTVEVVLASLAEQTLDRSEYEVVVGALEYSPEFLALCRGYTGRLDLISVMVDEEWNCSRARNLALSQVSGQVVVFLDADVVLPPDCLRSLYERYFAAGQNTCVLGQSIGYDNLVTKSAGTDDIQPYSHYREVFADLANRPDLRYDQRWRFEPVLLPWTIVWMGFVAVPAETVRRHALRFDEGFRGWGAEDQEWGYRVAASGTPIVRGEDVWGIHLPHARDVPANFEAFDGNKWYFLAKWPGLEVELYRAFDGWEANRRYPEVRREVAEALAGRGTGLGVARGTVDGADVLVVGAAIDGQARICDPALRPLLDSGFPGTALPLVGLALPYPDKSVAQCRLLPAIQRLSAGYRDIVLREAARVSHTVVAAA